MKTTLLKKLVSVISIFTILLVASFGQEKQSEKSLQKSLKRKLKVEDVKSYRTMNRLNFKPIVMDKEASKACSIRTPIELRTFDASPHSVPGVIYYINDIAQKSLSTLKEKKEFSIGSVIVKEKQEDQTEDSVKIITVMKKIKTGNKEDSWDYRLYDVTNWQEFKQLSFADKTKATPTHSVKCIDCHRKYREKDFISQTGMNLFFPK